MEDFLALPIIIFIVVLAYIVKKRNEKN